MAGVWTVDRGASQAPPIPIPGIEKQLEQFIRGSMLKLRTDGTAVVVIGGTATGKWTLEGDRIRLVPTQGAVIGPMGTSFEEISGIVSEDRTRIDLEIATSPFPLTMVLRKTS
jgi:hypothetical protein